MCSLKKSLSEDEIVLLEKNRNTFYKPLITADEIAHSSVSKKKGRTKINRPLNSFIVFKKNLNKVIKEKNYVWGKNMKNATRYASYLWRIANTEEKKIFDDIAKKSRKIHKELHPGYNYTPINKRTSNFVIVKFNNDDGKSNNHNNNNSNNNNININDNSNCHISDNSNFNINNNNNESNITSSTVTSTTSTTAFTTISSTKDNDNEGDDNNSSFTTIPSPSSITIIQPIITSPLLFSTASIPLHSITHPVSTTLLTYAFDMNNLPTDCYNNYNDNNYYTYSENYDNNGMLYTCTLDPNAYMTGDSDPLENPDDNSNLSILSILPNK